MTKAQTQGIDLDVLLDTPLASIDDFNERAANDTGVHLHLTRADGTKTGVVLQVIGEQSERIQAHVFRTINARRREEEVAKRKGKNADIRPIEDDVELTVEKAVISVTGWHGLREEFSEANLRKLFGKNPSFVQQVLEKSADAAAFTQGSSKG